MQVKIDKLILITNSGKSIWSRSENMGSYGCSDARV